MPDQIAVIILKREQFGFTMSNICKKMETECQQCRSWSDCSGVIWSGSSLFAQTCLYKYLESVQYFLSLQEAVGDTLEELWISYNNIEKLKGINVLKKLKVKFQNRYFYLP